MRHVKIIIEQQPQMDGTGNVWLATSEDMPGFTAEAGDRDGIFDLSRKLAFEFLHIDGEAAAEDKITFDFEVRE